MKLALIDFEDSFLFNIVSSLMEVTDCEVDVFHWRDSRAFIDYDGVILGPGPGHIDEYKSFYPIVENLLEIEMPLLGICLGHQLIWKLKGCRLERLTSPLHGESLELLMSLNHQMMKIKAQFYNSWYIVPTGDLKEHFQFFREMGVSACSGAIQTYQFHPESVGTNCRELIFKSFIEICYNNIYEKAFSSRRDLRQKNNSGLKRTQHF